MRSLYSIPEIFIEFFTDDQELYQLIKHPVSLERIQDIHISNTNSDSPKCLASILNAFTTIRETLCKYTVLSSNQYNHRNYTSVLSVLFGDRAIKFPVKPTG